MKKPHNLVFDFRRRLAGQVFVLFCALSVGALPVGSSLARQADHVDCPRFGIVEAYYRPDDARDLGVGWDRIIFDWAKFQPDNQYQFETEVIPEEWLIEAQEAGREVIGLLKSTPFWASGTGLIGAPPDNLDLPVDDPDNYWAAFVKRTVKHYGEEWGIDHWIILNEPDIRPGDMSWYEFDGDVKDYYRMLKVACQAAKAVNPDAVIHLAGMAWWVDVAAGRTPYLERLLDIAWSDPEAHENGFFFDVATVHVYYGTQSVWDVISQTKTILAQVGLHEKPVWIDETNAKPSDDRRVTLPPGAQFGVSLGQQADFIVQAAALSLAAGVEGFAVYRLYDNHYSPGLTEPWGLVRGDGSRRPAFRAYQTVIRTFEAATTARRYWSDRSNLVILEQGDRTIYVMWARGTAPVRFHVLADEVDSTATRINIYGMEDTLAAAVVPGVEDWNRWFVVETPGAVPDGENGVIVEGRPVMLVVDGPPRAVWVQVEGIQWRLR